MKYILLALISFYKNYLSIVLQMTFGVQGGCRFEKTCSRFAFESISEHGAMRGGAKAIQRVLQCQPFI